MVATSTIEYDGGSNDPKEIFKGEELYIEHADSQAITPAETDKIVTGTVQLTADGGVTLVPSPSADPKDPLNLPVWRKWVMLVILSLFSCVGNTIISSAGSLISFFLQDYIEAGKGYDDIVHLITIPTLSMGIGNLIFVPLALAIGRRPVFLWSCALLFTGAIIASQNTNYTYHLAIRIVLGFAAGQSEALVPLMIKETFFLHERAKVLSFQAAFQTIIGCILTIFASNIAASVGWKNWYSIYAGLSAALLIASVFFVIETKYDRPMAAYAGLTATTPNAPTSVDMLRAQETGVTESNRPALDLNMYGPRTLRYDLNPIPAKVNWWDAVLAFKHLGQMFWFPNIMLIILMNSWYLGVNIGMGTTYATLLQAAPYNWAAKWVGVAQSGQIVVAFIALPALGIFSDRLITWKAKRNHGIHEPEVRLIPLGAPIIIGVLSTVLYGAAYQYPNKFHWFVVLFSYCGSYFAFIAASVAGQTYLLDAYPTRSGSVLVLVCACRGLISFGLTYSLVPTTTAMGYLNAYSMYAGVMAGLGLLCLGLYFKGKAIRVWTLKFVIDDASDSDRPHYG